MISRIVACLKKATHVVVLLSYVFHGCAPCFGTRASFEAEEEQKKVTSIETLDSIMQKERAREEALRNKKKHKAFSFTSQNKQAPVRDEQSSDDGRYLGFRTQVKSFEEGYTLSVQSLPSQMNGSIWPGVNLTLTQKDGDEVRTLENRTFSSKTFDASTFGSMVFDDEEQAYVSSLKDRENRSLGFAYDLKGIGRIYVCWEGSLLLHNLHFRFVALNIQTTGAILANNLDGSRLNLEGRAIVFGGEKTKISSLSMGFSAGLQPEGFGSRIAHVMKGTTLVTHDLSIQGGILQNSGRLSALKSFEGIDTHVINDTHLTSGALTLKGGSLKNQGTLEASLTAEGIDLLDNSGVIEGSWSASSNTFLNTGSINGTGSLKTDALENYGLLGDATSVFNIQKTAHNDGYLTAGQVTGNGTVTNHNTFETEVLDVPVFLNQQRENVPFKPHVKGESLSVTKRVRQFTNDKDATIAVKRLVMESREGNARQVKNDGTIEGDQITLQGSLENKGTIRTQNFAWQGDTFKTEELQADHIKLEGERLQNLGSFEALSGALLLHHLENQGDMNLTVTTQSKVASLINKGSLTLNGTSGSRTLINEKKAKLFLKDGTLITRQLQNDGTVKLDGFVTVLRDGKLQFGKPSVLFGTWQAPAPIQGNLGLGVHLSVPVLDKLKKMPKTALHVYGKSYSNTSDRVFLHPLHLLVEAFSNTSGLRAPSLSVKAKTLENDGSIQGERVTVHATEKGRNSGRLEATERLDVDLPQIGWFGAFLSNWGLGTLISKGDLVFKNAHRSLTLDENQSWLQVGRNLHMTLLNGALKVTGNHKFPGNVTVESDRFTLKGSVETFGNLTIQTRSDIDIEGEQLEVVESLRLMNSYQEAHWNAESYQKLLQELSTTDKNHIFQYSLWMMGSDDMRRHRPMNFDQLLWFFDRQRLLNIIGNYIRSLYPPDFSDGTPKPNSYIFNLSMLKSGGKLILSGQNVNNTGGQVQGDESLTIKALQNILNGSSYETKRRESTLYSREGSLWQYPIPEVKGNGSFFSASGQLTLQAGADIKNNHGWMFGGTGFTCRSGNDTINLAGHILSGGKTCLSGSSFMNTREDVVCVKTGPDYNSNPHGRWFVNDEPDPRHMGRINHPVRDYPTSGPALVQSLDDITLDFSHEINNQASSILAGGRIDTKKAFISNLSINLIAQARLHAGNSWTDGPVSVHAGFLPAISSSGVALSLENFQGLVNTGILSAPRIQMKASRFVTFADPSASKTTVLAPRKQIAKSGSLEPQLHALQSLPFGERDQHFNPRSQVIIGSLDGSIPPLYGTTTQTLFALQQFFVENFHKGYILPYLKPLEQFIKFQSNARKLALKYRGERTLPWKPLVVSEEEAAKTTLPMILYRPILVEDQERLVPEYWGPKDLIHRFLMEPCGGAVADDLIEIQEIDDLDMTGSNMAAGEEINVEVKKLRDGALVVRQNTPYGHEDIPMGGNKEVGKPGKPGKIRLKGRDRFDVGGGSAETHGGTYRAQSDCPMHVGTTITHHLYDGEGTRREEARHHPFQLNTGDGRFITPDTLTLEATQAKATRTLWAEGSNILMPSVVDTYQEEQTTKQRDLFGSTTTKETTHRKSHQVLNFNAGISTNTIATSGSLDLTAPIMTAPKIVFDFPNGGLLLRAFANTFFYNREELDKNAFFITSSTSGSNSTTYGGSQFNGATSFTDGQPIHGELPEHEQDSETAQILKNAGANLSTVHNAFQSWEETKTSVGPGLSALIAIAVSLTMPALGVGVPGAMMTAGAKAVTSQTLVGLVNHQGNPLEALKDLGSGDSLRSLATTVLSAGLSEGILNVSGLPTGLGIEKTPLEHMGTASIRATVNSALNMAIMGKGGEDALRDGVIDTVVDSVGAIGANQISKAYRSHDLNVFTHKVAHAFLGGATGALLGDDPIRGAMSGALGAVAAEAMVELATKKAEDLSFDIIEEGLSTGSAVSKEAFEGKLQEHLKNKSDLARLAGTIAAIATDQDIGIASRTAVNAVENNFIPLIIGVGFVAYEIYDIADTCVNEGPDAAALKLGFTVGSAMLGGIVIKRAYTLGKIVMPSAIEAIQAYKAAHPLFAATYDKALAIINRVATKAHSLNQAVTDKANSIASRLLLRKRAAPEISSTAKKLTSITEPEATRIESSVTPNKIQRTPNKTSPGGKVSAARPDMGEYRKTGGHHVHAKKAFEGHMNYDSKKGFSMSNDYMESLGVNHSLVTAHQRKKFAALVKSGRPNTMKEHTRIAVESLVEGSKGMVSVEQARSIVAHSLNDLRNKGVRVPTNIPWYTQK